jgi:L-lysine exporter family protein LysE/ArgO
LIVAIGAQNAYVLRQGLAGRHIGLIVTICAASDVLLIAAGVAGVGALIRSHPEGVTVVRWIGAAYLLAYGAMSLRSAARPTSLTADGRAARGRRTAIVTTLALTFLNPHVYLDTVVMLGSVANGYGDYRWQFAGGAALGSVLWFSGLGYGARVASSALDRPRTWRALDLVIGCVMIALAVRLVRS